MSDVFDQGTGWLPEDFSPDDLLHHHDEIQEGLKRRGVCDFVEGHTVLPPRMDLRRWAPRIHFQGGYNTCSAHVVACLLEYFENKTYGTYTQASRLFIYKVAKNYLQQDGNSGVYIRQAMGVLKSIGTPPEKFWPYVKAGSFHAPLSDDPRIDEEPTAFCYAVAEDFEAVSYYRLDDARAQRDDSLLRRAKAHLAAGLPFAFGFPLYGSLKQSVESGKVLFPAEGEESVGHHAVVAMGYDDTVRIGGEDGHPETLGALLVHNSWGLDWGEKGYGWIPYRYVEHGLTADFWTLIRAEWENLSVSQLVPAEKKS